MPKSGMRDCFPRWLLLFPSDLFRVHITIIIIIKEKALKAVILFKRHL